MKQYLPQLTNATLRTLSLFSRLALLFGLAVWLEPEKIGLYGLFAATIAFCILLIGADFYTYSHRELLSLPRHEWSFVLQHHLLALAGLYALFLPLLIGLFWLGFLPWSLSAWFFLILVLEHLSQEINRLLVIMGRPLVAGWVIFTRMGAWVWLLLSVMYIWPDSRELDSVLFAWSIGGGLALLVGGYVAVGEVPSWRLWNWKTQWVMRGLKVGGLFLIATLCVRALFAVDRYTVEYLAGLDKVGVYSVFAGIAMAMIGFLDSSVFAFIYPRVVASYRRGDHQAFYRGMRELTLSAIVVCILLAGAIGLLAPLVLGFLPNSIYLENIHILWLLLLASVIFALSHIPHFGLYAQSADRSILIAHLISPVWFFLVVSVTAQHYPFASVAIGLIGAFTWIMVFKLWRYRVQLSSRT